MKVKLGTELHVLCLEDHDKVFIVKLPTIKRLGKGEYEINGVELKSTYILEKRIETSTGHDPFDKLILEGEVELDEDDFECLIETLIDLHLIDVIVGEAVRYDDILDNPQISEMLFEQDYDFLDDSYLDKSGFPKIKKVSPGEYQVGRYSYYYADSKDEVRQMILEEKMESGMISGEEMEELFPNEDWS